ncbi:MAG: type II toxin-antitoxin system VapC family toxin [Chloroflexi bacterium]|uniref:Ribonuclease VapC n=1 Tax=Candidatus Chlorohelix allophototropha TaxID=3003348 RepID=A0A8T7LYW8_9CHLR|nr:type II toxin-antitoxin system VapC family toxin [Chloroflexota bacterium]WJW67375.1 type II toxin-antitoxin system VapC family toxin [Chloroflexota bacterium L227-S17]
MIYLLDSNTCIKYMNGRSIEVLHRLQALPTRDIGVCSVVKAELYYGAMKSQDPARSLAAQMLFLNQFVSLPFDDVAAEIYGQERARLTLLGTPIGANDLLIASIALANGLTLVTHNTREFSRINGLRLEDWETTF